MDDQLDQVMESASQALAEMDYLNCEQCCLKALELARDRCEWDYYARILLPLQEARRQRRMIAAEGTVRLGSTTLDRSVEDWLDGIEDGCIVLTQPHTPGIALEVALSARRQHMCVEVLYADSRAEADQWTLRSFAGPAVSCAVQAPPEEWRDRDWPPGSFPAPAASEAQAPASQGKRHWQPQPTRTPADWFLDAAEALGDAALAQVQGKSYGNEHARLSDLERCLDVVTDHEILHQRLGDTARALCHGLR